MLGGHGAQQVIVADARALVQRPGELRGNKEDLQGDTPCTPPTPGRQGSCAAIKRTIKYTACAPPLLRGLGSCGARDRIFTRPTPRGRWRGWRRRCAPR